MVYLVFIHGNNHFGTSAIVALSFIERYSTCSNNVIIKGSFFRQVSHVIIKQTLIWVGLINMYFGLTLC